jgi:hypothetical protein
MTREAGAGFAVLAVVVAAIVGWLALGPEPRHDGLTRARAERFARGGIPSECIRSSRCRATEGHWRCRTELVDGQTVGWSSNPDPHAPAGAFVFFCTT